jgi:predicted kinase
VEEPPGSAPVYLLCGLTFAGKSTLAAALAAELGARVVSLDEINARRGLRGGEGIAGEEWLRTHRIALAELAAVLRQPGAAVIDDTNCYRWLRDAYRAVASAHGRPAVVLHLDLPLAEALARLRHNRHDPSRPPVREDVLHALAAGFEPPGPDERSLVIPWRADPLAWVREHLRG